MTAKRATRASQPPALDELDRALVSALVEDGRASLTDLAARLAMSRAALSARLDRLRQSGVVTAVRAEVPPAALGLVVTAMILVNAEQRSWEQVRASLVDLPGFEYLAMTSGELDFFVIVHVADVAALRDVVLQRVHRIEGVRSTRTTFVLDDERRPVGLRR